MIKAVFFDVANTLLYKPDLYSGILFVLAKNGISIEKDTLIKKHRLLSEVFSFPDKTSQEFYQNFNAELLYLLGVPPDQQLVDEIFTRCSYLPWQAFEDTDFLENIPQPLGILSNWDRSLREKLEQYFPSRFMWLLSSQVEGLRKPNPAFFELMIEKAGCQPGEIVYVGDSVKLDIVPGRCLGIKTILIDRLDLYRGSSLNRITDMHQLAEHI